MRRVEFITEVVRGLCTRLLDALMSNFELVELDCLDVESYQVKEVLKVTGSERPRTCHCRLTT